MHPGEPGQGIVFRRGDHRPPILVPATAAHVVASERRTSLERNGARIETVEHCLAAAAALELDDLVVELNGPELPILDGSFAPFVEALDRAGVVARPEPARCLSLEDPLEISEAGATYRVEPAHTLEFDVTFTERHPQIGTQHWAGSPLGETFRQTVAPARTFGRLREVERYRAQGLLRGASPDCAIALSDDEVIGPPLRWPDEFVRHKAGDLLGDLALVGGRLRARVKAHQPHHRGNLACARAILDVARISEE